MKYKNFFKAVVQFLSVLEGISQTIHFFTQVLKVMYLQVHKK